MSNRGIKANPDKIKALIEMESPKRLKDVQKLTGCMTALNRFISKATDKFILLFQYVESKQTLQVDGGEDKIQLPILSKHLFDAETR